MAIVRFAAMTRHQQYMAIVRSVAMTSVLCGDSSVCSLTSALCGDSSVCSYD